MDILFKKNDGNIIKHNGTDFCGPYTCIGCNECPIKNQLGHNPKNGECIEWVENNTKKATEPMEYTLIQENKNKDEQFDRIKRHLEIVTGLNKLYSKKNHDYGNSFGETYQKLGIISALTRISDKYNRLVSLATKPEEERKVKDESIQDTLLDMANYCIMTVIEMEAEKENT